MSNPAVTKLQRKKIGRYEVWLDDNIGERMHLHINRFRVDLDYPEMEQLCSDICAAMNELLQIPGLDISKLDPVFLEHVLCTERCRLYDLKKVCDDEVKLSELWVEGERIKKLDKSVFFKELSGDAASIKEKGSDHIDQTPAERMQECLKSVRENGYPWNEQYIIVYGDNNIIKDGQHRAACLLKEKGDITVPVKRYYYDPYIPQNEKIRSSILGPLYMKFYRFADKTNSLKITLKAICSGLRKLIGKKNLKKAVSAVYCLVNKKEVNRMRTLLDEV